MIFLSKIVRRLTSTSSLFIFYVEGKITVRGKQPVWKIKERRKNGLSTCGHSGQLWSYLSAFRSVKPVCQCFETHLELFWNLQFGCGDADGSVHADSDENGDEHSEVAQRLTNLQPEQDACITCKRRLSLPLPAITANSVKRHQLETGDSVRFQTTSRLHGLMLLDYFVQ